MSGLEHGAELERRLGSRVRVGVVVEMVVASAEVLHHRVTLDHDAGGAVGLQAAHQLQPCFQPAVVALDRSLAYWSMQCSASVRSAIIDASVGDLPVTI